MIEAQDSIPSLNLHDLLSEDFTFAYSIISYGNVILIYALLINASFFRETATAQDNGLV